MVAGGGGPPRMQENEMVDVPGQWESMQPNAEETQAVVDAPIQVVGGRQKNWHGRFGRHCDRTGSERGGGTAVRTWGASARQVLQNYGGE